MTAVPGAAAALPADKRRPWYARLSIQVFAAILVGGLLGWLDPELGADMKVLGDAFIKAIRMIIGPIIFTTVVVGIAKMGDMRRIAQVGVKALVYFEIVSTLALVMGLVAVNLYKPGAGMNADAASLDAKLVAGYVTGAQSLNLVNFFLGMIPDSVVEAFAKGDVLPIVLFSVLFGLALSRHPERTRPLIDLLDQVSRGLFGIVGLIMVLAPLGAFGAMAFTIGKYGLGTLWQLGQLIAGVYVVSILFVVLVLGAALRLAGFPLWKTLRYFADEILIVFGATSAESMMPRVMLKLERMGCAREVVGLVIPTGYSFNMDATSIYMTMAVMFIAQATNVELSWTQQFTILFVMLFTSKGAAGVTGGGFIALAATMPAIGVLPIGGLALLLGIDRFMAQIRAAVNLTGNAIATVVIARWCRAIDVEQAHRALDGKLDDEVEADA
jgi:aerobic C4-dicarboxylate transport protein